jgi:hypothetical protein
MARQHDPEWLAECRERAPGIAQKFAAGLGQGATVLASPGCPKKCSPCVHECAIRYIIADWWTREHALAEVAARNDAHRRDGNVIHVNFGKS